MVEATILSNIIIGCGVGGAVLSMKMMSGETGWLVGCFSKKASKTVNCLECSEE